MSSSTEILEKYKNYTPEVVEYDEKDDGGALFNEANKDISISLEPLHYQLPSTQLGDTLKEKYASYVPEVVEYDEEHDGTMISVRDKHLSEKEKLKQIFEKRLKAVSSGKTAR